MNLIFQRMVTGLAALFASILVTACGAHSTNQSTETFTVYEDAPKMNPLDLGAPGSSLGDVYHFSAPLHSERGGPVTGEVIGSKTLVKVATCQPEPGEACNDFVFYVCRSQGPDHCVRSCRLFAVRSRVRCWPACRPSGFRRDRQVHGCAWPGHQHPECGWFVHASIHVIEVIGIEFKDA